MSSPQLEEFLARLYTDEVLREQFIRNPELITSEAILSPEEVSAMRNIDLAGLQMAAASYANKRASYRCRPQSIFSKFLGLFQINRSHPPKN
jgi:hypothetical protein